MDQLIPIVSEKLGIDETTSRRALGALLKFLKEQAARTDFDFDDEILTKLDGSSEAVEEEEKIEEKEAGTSSTSTSKRKSSSSSSSSLLLGIFGLVWSLLKIFGVLTLLKQLLQPLLGDYAVKLIDGVEDGADLAGVFSSLGINREQGVTIVQTAIGFLKEKLDPETIDALVEQIPALKLVISEGKKEE
jgi:hypothetical protein